MKTRKLGRRLLSLALSVLMVLALFPAAVFADTEKTPNATIIACSDLQSYINGKYGASDPALIKEIFDKMEFTAADALLFGGDYGVGGTAPHLNTLKTAVDSWNLGFKQKLYIQGNHDDDLVGNGMDTTGAHDPTGDLAGKYGVYLINHKDYPEYPINKSYDKDGSKTRAAADGLKVYLDQKLEENFKKPIFIMTHLGLHYSSRTINRSDGTYANYIFDVVNEAAGKGLNIIFLFAHNHSGGWDDFIGGSSVYLKKGDKINIAQASQTVYKEETLNFTYMNAGYIGYFTAKSTCDTTLTATKFLIYDDEVVITRYDKNGVHNLKSAGVRSTADDSNKAPFPANEIVYTSPQTVKLEGVTPPSVDVTLTTDKTSYVVGDAITFTATVPTSAQRVYITNEFGEGQVATSSHKDNGDGTTTWTFQLSLGTVGERTFGVAVNDIVSATSEFKLTSAPAAPVALISVDAPETAMVNVPFTTTFVTSNSVTVVRLFNENGAGMAPTACTYVDNADGTRTWSYTISVGSIGFPRTFTAKVADASRSFIGDEIVKINISAAKPL